MMVFGRSVDHLALVAVSFIWGLNFVSTTVALQGLTPWQVRSVSFGGGALILIVTAVVLRVSLRLRHKRDYLRLWLAGVFSIGGFGALSAIALLHTSTGRATIVVYTMPIWATLFSRIFLGEKLGNRRAAAVLIGVAGLAILIWPLVQSGVSGGVLAALGAAVSWAIGTVYLKKAAVQAHPLSITVWQLTAGVAVSLIGLAIAPRDDPGPVGASVVIALAFSTILAVAAAYLIWFRIVAHLPASVAGMGTLLVPVFGVVASIVVLGERLSTVDAVAFTLILFAALISLQARPKSAAARP